MGLWVFYIKHTIKRNKENSSVIHPTRYLSCPFLSFFIYPTIYTYLPMWFFKGSVEVFLNFPSFFFARNLFNKNKKKKCIRLELYPGHFIVPHVPVLVSYCISMDTKGIHKCLCIILLQMLRHLDNLIASNYWFPLFSFYSCQLSTFHNKTFFTLFSFWKWNFFVN